MNKNPETIGAEPCYVARKRCGCMVSAIVDKPEHTRDVQVELAKWRRSGLTVERAVVADVWSDFVGWDCPHEYRQERFP